ncbi:MAG: hypothetical protein ACE5GT_08270 [Rhodospirillales bacterium]
MLKDWLFGKIRTQALSAGTKETETFVTGLKAMGDRELGALVAVATVIRVNMDTHGVIAEDVFGDGPLPSAEILGRTQMHINKVARQFTKLGLPSDAAGAMVWSYTLRCLNVPELMPLGREMWAELRRGFPHVEEALKAGEAEKGEPFPERVWAEWGNVPAEFRAS